MRNAGIGFFPTKAGAVYCKWIIKKLSKEGIWYEVGYITYKNFADTGIAWYLYRTGYEDSIMQSELLEECLEIAVTLL